jgi:hypothetical protein
MLGVVGTVRAMARHVVPVWYRYDETVTIWTHEARLI